ncbi:MAG: hypothetical protein SF162_07100 [bacterium]|nr:hypothetical protein [bacterium]
MKALILEREPAALRGTMKALQAAKVDVIGVTSVAEARAALGTYAFQIFVCDADTVDAAGHDLHAEQIAHLHADRHNVLVLSHGTRYVVMCERMGCELPVAKPLPPASLYNIILRAMHGTTKPAFA